MCYEPKMVTFPGIIAAFFRANYIGKQALVLENLALRQQLGVYLRKQKQPRLKVSDRFFLVLLSKVWDGWRSSLVIVKPDTVIGWHRQGFRLYWRWRSRTKKVGRPRIPRRHIEFIKRIGCGSFEGAHFTPFSGQSPSANRARWLRLSSCST